ncbi:glycosyltransferase family 4 protein [Desulfobacter curvatus]|uniref:glycosyltransferase family 4 protein n=1 Tax=Desulfobacter curvatus TaxID=2290 RepID=UPI0003690265|nr:glycosyltransferase family 4 protein [Desulfobacter curvatus]
MKILIIVENLPVPFDRRVWQEATTLQRNGHSVSILCPVMKGYNKRYEVLDGIHIYRHPLPMEGSGAAGYLVEYASALFFQFSLSLKVLVERGFDVIHACNPPDNIFLVGGFFKLVLGKKFLFDHHDINPELYIAKFGRKDLFYRCMLLWEKLTFKTADVSIATNHSYRRIAIERGKMKPENVHVVRSGPDLDRARRVAPNDQWKNNKTFMVGYVGVMGAQEGLDYLLNGIKYLVHELKRVDTHFVLVGGGTELESLKMMMNDLDIEDFVTFTGRVSDAVLMEILSTADVCVNPDVVNEMNDKSTMNKIMEYMALGKPIVQFEMTEGRFSAQKASLYAAPNDHRSLMDNIIKVLDDSDLAQRMGDFGRRRVISELQWTHEIPKLLNAYDQLS